MKTTLLLPLLSLFAASLTAMAADDPKNSG